MLDLGSALIGKESHRNNGVSVPVHCIKELMPVCLIISDVNLDHLVEVISSGFLYYKE